MSDAGPWFSCPVPASDGAHVMTLAHGEGGRLSRRFIREHIVARFGNDALQPLDDSARLSLPGADLSFTTDGYTVTPLFFPGGDIGRLAVFGTVNDLAVSGSLPLWLSLGMIIEEGTPVALIDRVLDSIAAAATAARVQIVTGDTKVVPRGAADQLYVTTAGIGRRHPNASPGAAALQAGDVILVSGPIGCHGAAILCTREGLDFQPAPVSDCAPVAEPILALLDSGLRPRAIRDATRGGVAAILHEWAESSQSTCTIDERSIPVTPAVRAVCELLGLDPIHLANEGTFVLAAPPDEISATLEVLHRFELTRSAAVVGRIGPQKSVAVSVIRASGQEVPVEDPTGTPLPRIC